MRNVFFLILFSQFIFATTVVEYNSAMNIKDFAVDIESTTGLCLIRKSPEDISDGYISRKGNKTRIVLNNYVSTATIIPQINSAVGQEGAINPEAGFTTAETAIGITVILASILMVIKTKNIIFLLPIVIIFLIWFNCKNRGLKK